jgi:hypothetical protein
VAGVGDGNLNLAAMPRVAGPQRAKLGIKRAFAGSGAGRDAGWASAALLGPAGDGETITKSRPHNSW